VRVLFLNSSVGWGGMEMHPLALAEGLSADGVPLLYALRRGTPSQRHANGRRFAPGSFPFRWLLHPGCFLALGRMARAFGVDVVHVHASRDAWQALLLAAGMGRRRRVLVLSRHLASPAGTRKSDPLHRLLARRVDAMVAMSGYIRENILAAYEISPEKVHVIPYGVGADARGEAGAAARIRRGLGVPGDALLVGMVAQVTPDKRQDLFVDAAERVLRRMPACRFVLAGAPVRAEDGAELRRRIAAGRLEGKVIDAGFRRDIPHLMRALDVLVLPSRAEAFGLVLLEAMANGRPVVGSASGAVPEIVRAGENGLLFAPGDAGDLAEALLCLLRSREARERMGRAGEALVRDRYSLAREVQATRSLYRWLLETAAPERARTVSGQAPAEKSCTGTARSDTARRWRRT